jgi:SAM-dependent methyltransferase
MKTTLAKSRYPGGKNCTYCNLCRDLTFVSRRYLQLIQELIGSAVYKGDSSYADTYNKTNKDYHAFIPSCNTSGIIKALEYVKRYLKAEMHPSDRTLKFLDCGCGVGNIMYLALQVDYDVTGIEYEAFVYEAAKKLLRGYSHCRVLRGDILNYGEYNLYDVIYYYVPIQTLELMRKFSDKLIREMKVGAVVIPYGHKPKFPKGTFKSLRRGMAAYIKVKEITEE